MSSDTDNVVVDEEPFAGAGVSLFRRSVVPANGAAWARLGVLHGYGDHSGRYGHFLRWMAARGAACHTFDFRGHGRAGGRRGFVSVWDEYLGDLDAFLRLPALQPGDASAPPLFLLGQSHGGLVLAAAGIRGLPGIAGAILTAPYLRGKMVVPAGKVALARVASRVLPWLPVPSGVAAEWMCSDEEMQRENRSDTLALRTATPRWFVCTQAVQDDVLRRAPEFRLPLLLLMGDADPLADIEAAAAFHARAGSPDKTFRRYPEHRHELLRETRRVEIFGHLLEWLRKHVV